MRKAISFVTNVVATTIAAALSVSLIMSGTFAWQSFNQEATNKSSGLYGVGGRLHTDFDGEMKHVYIENYKEVNGGNDIYVRIRMEEYLEVGKDAGYKDAATRNPVLTSGELVVKGNSAADINNPDTWDIVYMGNSGIAQGFPVAREYVTLNFGGQGVYMPTFNKNDDSREGVINGTLAGDDLDDHKLGDKYSDYTHYVLSGSTEPGVTTETKLTTYDVDDNDIEEESPLPAPSFTFNTGYNIYQVVETHETKETLESTKIINMLEWQIMYSDYNTYLENIKQDPSLEGDLVEPESPIGPYWVFDEDGWVYWAQPLEPSTATGLLLRETVPLKADDGEWYYEISHRAEYATRGDWGDVDNSTGFHKEGVSEKALVLLQTISGTVIK